MNNSTQVFVPRRLYDMFKFQDIEFSKILDLGQLSIELGIETVAKLIDANNLYNESSNDFLFPLTNIGLPAQPLLDINNTESELVNKLTRRLDGIKMAGSSFNDYLPEVKADQINVPLLFKIKTDVIGVTVDTVGVNYEVVNKEQLKQTLLLQLLKQLSDLGVSQKDISQMNVFTDFIKVTGK